MKPTTNFNDLFKFSYNLPTQFATKYSLELFSLSFNNIYKYALK